jgi:hypothetical protein
VHDVHCCRHANQLTCQTIRSGGVAIVELAQRRPVAAPDAVHQRRVGSRLLDPRIAPARIVRRLAPTCYVEV